MKIIAFATIRFGEFPRAMMPGLLTRSLGQEPGLSFPVPFWFILGAAMLCASHPAHAADQHRTGRGTRIES